MYPNELQELVKVELKNQLCRLLTVGKIEVNLRNIHNGISLPEVVIARNLLRKYNIIFDDNHINPFFMYLYFNNTTLEQIVEKVHSNICCLDSHDSPLQFGEFQELLRMF